MLVKSIKVAVLIVVALFIANVVYYSVSRPNVALVRLDGIITDAKASRIIETLHSIEGDDSLKAGILVINSPGGSANASERIFLALRKLAKIKPVVALIQDIGASGAYYAACGASCIVAYPTSVVGSIGVLIESINISELARRLGIKPFVIKSGRVKDAGNPLREPTKADIKMLQGVVTGIYEQFLDDVAKSRKISIEKLKPYADGSVFAAKQALKIGLIDRIGTMDTAKEWIRKKAHIKNIKMEKFGSSSGFVDKLLGEQLSCILGYLKLAVYSIPETLFHVGD